MAEKADIKHSKSLKKRLDALYKSYDFEGRVGHDPIRVPMRYKKKGDVEAAAFLASIFAYGSVKAFLPVLDKVVGVMGASPYEFLGGFNAKRDAKLLKGIRYRFYTTADVTGIIHVMAELIRKHKSIEGAFMAHYKDDDPNIGPALAGLMDEALSVDTSPVYGKNMRPQGFMFAFPSPSKGSTCKRHNLFLRWMVRRSDIDFGLWRGVSPSKLVIPLDTHIARVSRCLGFTRRKANDWKTAVEITESLRALDAGDPLKYDFALCHRGITGMCAANKCKECEFERA